MKINYKKLTIIIIITFLIATIPTWFIDMGVNYYNKPPLNPPAILFPIVWSILFILMSISYYLVSNNKKLGIIYLIQLVINSLWSVFFFGFNWYLFSFIWIIVLLTVVIYMTCLFYVHNKISGYLLIPYALWLIFAGYLNLSIYVLNM